MNDHAHFANVEFELESNLSLKPLLDEFGEKISLHYHDRLENGNDFVSFDLTMAETGVYGNVNATLSAFCDLFEDLSPLAKEIWWSCVKREMDVGFESGDSKMIYEGRIENNTLENIARIGATIEITLYPLSSS